MEIESLSTRDSCKYLGVANTTFNRYRVKYELEPVKVEGQTYYWAIADLNTVREKVKAAGFMANGKPKSPQHIAGQSGSMAAQKRKEALTEVLSVLQGQANQALSRAELKELNKTGEETLRHKALELLVKCNSLEKIAADLDAEGYSARHSAFKLLKEMVLPNLQSVSIDKQPDVDKAKQTAVLERATRLIAEQERRLRLLPPGEVIEAEVLSDD